MEQGSPEWFEARRGKVTASRIADALAKTRSGWGASRANYMAQLVAERLTGRVEAGYTNAAMQHGNDTEPEARASYAFMVGDDVQEVGFIDHPRIKMSGASPDGLVGDVGMAEIKCPTTATHIETLLGAAIPQKYLYQMQWQMACCDRQWCDFVSYDPRMPIEMQLHIQRVDRDDELIAELEAGIQEFLAELDQKISALTKQYRKAA